MNNEHIHYTRRLEETFTQEAVKQGLLERAPTPMSRAALKSHFRRVLGEGEVLVEGFALLQVSIGAEAFKLYFYLRATDVFGPDPDGFCHPKRDAHFYATAKVPRRDPQLIIKESMEKRGDQKNTDPPTPLFLSLKWHVLHAMYSMLTFARKNGWPGTYPIELITLPWYTGDKYDYCFHMGITRRAISRSSQSESTADS